MVHRGTHSVNLDEAIGIRRNHVTALDLLASLRQDYFSNVPFDDMDERLLDDIDRFLESPKVID